MNRANCFRGAALTESLEQLQQITTSVAGKCLPFTMGEWETAIDFDAGRE
jgi:hypothetical protein